MHFKTHALVNCVAWFSLLCCSAGNAAKAPAPSELLSHFARVGSALPSTLAGHEIPNPLKAVNRSAAQTTENQSASRRQVDTRPVQQDGNEGGLQEGFGGPGGFQQQPGFPYQLQQSYQYRYPQFNQREQLAQNFFPGAQFNGLLNGFPVDPRFFQSQFAGGNQPIGPGQGDGGSRPLSVSLNRNAVNANLKDSVNNNVNTIQSIEASNGEGVSGDSKSSVQNRPFDGQDFSSVTINQPGIGNLDPANGNVRLDNSGYANNYERIRQNYYSDPPINQQRYYSFNEIPFSGGAAGAGAGAGLPFRPQFAGLDFNGRGPGRGAGGGVNSELRPGSGVSGLNDPYFGSFIQGSPYQSPNFNAIPGSSVGASGLADAGGPAFDGFDRQANFGSPFNGVRYPGDFGGAAGSVGGVNGFFQGGAGGIGSEQAGGFQDGEASLRGSSSRESLSEAAAPEESVDASLERFGNSPSDRVDKTEKVKYVSAGVRPLSLKEKKGAA